MSAAAATAGGGTGGSGGMGASDPESHYGHDGVSFTTSQRIVLGGRRVVCVLRAC